MTLLLGWLPVHYTGFIIMTLLLGLLPVHYTGFIIMTVAQFAASTLHRFHYYDCCSVCCQYTIQVSLL